MSEETHRALVHSSFSSPATVQRIPKPKSTPGSALVKVLLANVLPYARIVYNGTRGAPMPLPLVIGLSAIGRIESVGPDATKLAPGQLVWVDCFIHARDDPSTNILFGYREGHTEGSRKLMREAWRDATFAEFAKVPLENCYRINEGRLLGAPADGGFGYRLEDLAYLTVHAVPYAGLRDMNVQAGDTVLIAPATGTFSGAAVQVAVAMGAKVIAAGRNLKVLKELAERSSRIEIAHLKCDDMEADLRTLKTFGQIDAYLDLSPPTAAKSTHIESCLMAVKPYGKVSIMGGIREHVKLPYFPIMLRSIRIYGRFMCERDHLEGLIKLYEGGILQLGTAGGYKETTKFALEDWTEACVRAEETAGWNSQVLLDPWQGVN
ncbi:MAG: hypothetical protein Q9220_002830 [cf. Caloplaca sp. 1 TL-2023]